MYIVLGMPWISMYIRVFSSNCYAMAAMFFFFILPLWKILCIYSVVLVFMVWSRIRTVWEILIHISWKNCSEIKYGIVHDLSILCCRWNWPFWWKFCCTFTDAITCSMLALSSFFITVTYIYFLNCFLVLVCFGISSYCCGTCSFKCNVPSVFTWYD